VDEGRMVCSATTGTFIVRGSNSSGIKVQTPFAPQYRIWSPCYRHNPSSSERKDGYRCIRRLFALPIPMYTEVHRRDAFKRCQALGKPPTYQRIYPCSPKWMGRRPTGHDASGGRHSGFDPGWRSRPGSPVFRH